MALSRANGWMLGDPSVALTGEGDTDSGGFDGTAADQYLSLTPSVTGDADRHSIQMDVRRGNLGAAQTLISAGTAANGAIIRFTSSDTLEVVITDTSSVVGRLVTSAVYQDSGGYYDILYVYDSANGTAGDRMRLYVNGVEVTAFGTDTNPGLNQDGFFTTNIVHNIGREVASTSEHFDGSFSRVHILDGIAASPTDFGRFNVHENWVPVSYAGAYGDEGSQLLFAVDTSDLGDDTSGNGNNWTVNGAAGPTQTLDRVSNVFPVFNTFLDRGNNASYRLAGRRYVQSAGNSTQASIPCTHGVASGKWYFEFTVNSPATGFGHGFGIWPLGSRGLHIVVDPLSDPDNLVYNTDGQFYDGASGSAYGNTFGTGDVIGVAFDADNGNLWFSKNGTWQNSATQAEIEAGTTTNAAKTGIDMSNHWFPCAYDDTGGGVIDITCNFGQVSFSGTAPSGYASMSSSNYDHAYLTTAGSFNAETILYDMDATSGPKQVGSLNFDPDMVWAKNRDRVTNWAHVDQSYPTLGASGHSYPDINGTQQIDADGYVSALSSGTPGTITFSAGATDNTNFNNNSDRGAAWAFNDDDELNGMDIVHYTGNGANRTVAHALTRKPVCIFIAKLDVGGGAANIRTYFQSVGATAMYSLSGNAASDTDSTYMQDTEPTTSVFSLGTHTAVNENGTLYAAWLFAEIPGAIHQGRYRGTGLSDFRAPQIYCGFRPQIIIIKRHGLSRTHLYDDRRSTYNGSLERVIWGNTQAESTTLGFKKFSWGYSPSTSDSQLNGSGVDYDYIAWARHPQWGFGLPPARAF